MQNVLETLCYVFRLKKRIGLYVIFGFLNPKLKLVSVLKILYPLASTVHFVMWSLLITAFVMNEVFPFFMCRCTTTVWICGV